MTTILCRNQGEKPPLLSQEEAQCIASFTDNSATINGQLGRSISTPEFSPSVFREILLLKSIILNKGHIRNRPIYNLFRRNLKVQTENEIIPKEDMKVLQTYQESTFISTTSSDSLIPFFENFQDNGCCIALLNTQQIPVLNLEGYSTYPFQKEVLCPPGLHLRVKAESTMIVDFLNCRPFQTGKLLYGFPIYDIQCEKKDGNETPVHLKEIEVTTRFLGPEIAELANEILFLYEGSYNYHDHDHASRTAILSVSLCGLLEEVVGIRITDEQIRVIFLASLFHDVGRKGRSGVDLWERDSAKKAHDFLEGTCFANLSERVSKVIMGKDLLSSVYKGADSIEISRLTTFDPEKNPFAEYIRENYPQKYETIVDHLEKLSKDISLFSKVCEMIIEKKDSSILHGDIFSDERVTDYLDLPLRSARESLQRDFELPEAEAKSIILQMRDEKERLQLIEDIIGGIPDLFQNPKQRFNDMLILFETTFYMCPTLRYWGSSVQFPFHL